MEVNTGGQRIEKIGEEFWERLRPEELQIRMMMMMMMMIVEYKVVRSLGSGKT